MGWIISFVIFVSLPLIVWLIIGMITGVKSFYPPSVLAYICEFLSVYLFPLGIFLYRKKKTKYRPWTVLALVASVPLLIFSIIYLENDLSHAREREQSLAQWKDSTLASCRSFAKDWTPSKGDIDEIDLVWKLTYGQFVESGEPLILHDLNTPEEWNNAVQVLTIIDESYQGAGQTYVKEDSKAPTGIQAVVYTWNVSICDLVNRRVIEKVLVGPEPPKTITTSQHGGVYGITPRADYQAWLETLGIPTSGFENNTPEPEKTAIPLVLPDEEN